MDDVNLQKLKDDHSVNGWFTEKEAAHVWDMLNPNGENLGREKFCRRLARLPDLEKVIIDHSERQYHIGPLTFAKVFQAAQLTNIHDMQAVLDAMEKALSE